MSSTESDIQQIWTASRWGLSSLWQWKTMLVGI